MNKIQVNKRVCPIYPIFLLAYGYVRNLLKALNSKLISGSENFYKLQMTCKSFVILATIDRLT